MHYGYYKPRKNYQCFVPNDLCGSEYFDNIIKIYSEQNKLCENKIRLLNSANKDYICNFIIPREIREAHKIKTEIEGSKYHETDIDINIANYLKSLKIAVNYLKSEPFDVPLIAQLNSIILNRNECSHLRTMQNWYGKGKIDSADFIFTPPELVKPKIKDLLTFINNKDIDAIAQAIIAHIQFESIHPFADGNGRVGRLLFTLILYNRKILNYPTLYLGRYTKHYTHYYHKCEMCVRNQDDWNPWFNFHYSIINDYINSIFSTATNIN